MEDMVAGHSPGAGIKGLYRTQIAGAGRSLTEAFARLEGASGVERVLRHTKHDSLSARVTLRPEEGEGYFELTRIRSDLFIILSNFTYHEARHEIVPGDGLVQFNFKISGDLTYDVRLPGPLRFQGPGLHLWRQPTGIDMREWTAPRAHERMVTICVRPEFLTERFLAGNSAGSPHLKTFLSDGGASIDFCELPMTQAMLALILKLLDNPYSGSMYVVYKEALALELLCAAIGSDVPPDPHSSLSSQNLKAVRAARRILEGRVSDPLTVEDLARAVGVTPKTLTQAFRSIYGQTVHGFSFRLRMDQALTLLRDRRSVDEVSEAVGYTHPTSFTTAFRRHFGLRPIDIKPNKHRPRTGSSGVIRNS